MAFPSLWRELSRQRPLGWAPGSPGVVMRCAICVKAFPSNASLSEQSAVLSSCSGALERRMCILARCNRISSSANHTAGNGDEERPSSKSCLNTEALQHSARSGEQGRGLVATTHVYSRGSSTHRRRASSCSCPRSSVRTFCHKFLCNNNFVGVLTRNVASEDIILRAKVRS